MPYLHGLVQWIGLCLEKVPFLSNALRSASILENATEDSDELGRGTSTFDGYAIAYLEFVSHPHVTLQHMVRMLKPRNGGGDIKEELTFLYRLTSGACPESYGLQVATMSGLPRSIVERASVAGKMMRSKIAGNFKSSEERAELSTLHEEWVRKIVAIGTWTRTPWTRCSASSMS